MSRFFRRPELVKSSVGNDASKKTQPATVPPLPTTSHGKAEKKVLRERVNGSNLPIRRRSNTKAPITISDDGFRQQSASPYSKCIRKIAQNEWGLRFSLTGFTPLESLALGIGDLHSVIVYLRKRKAKQTEFCVHVSSDPNPLNWFDERHNYWCMDWKPDRLCCNGEQNRLTYQLSRKLWFQITSTTDKSWTSLGSGRTSLIEDIYQQILRWLRRLPKDCITCGGPQAARLYRPTTCSARNRSCQILLRRSMLTVRLMDTDQDGSVVELLLAAIRATAQADIEHILEEFPLQDSLGVLEKLRDRLQDPKFLKSEGMFPNGTDPQRATKLLLCWACLQYGGFLMSLSCGPFFVPDLPASVSQFLLVDAKPSLQQEFDTARARYLPPSQPVFFHGTSLDRLYAILSQGLRSLSNSSLEKNGKNHGAGVYLTDSLTIALSYTRKAPNYSAKTSRTLPRLDYGVLLCVEVACHIDANAVWDCGGKIFVVSDERVIILRYVFLVPIQETGVVASSENMRRVMASKFKALEAGRGPR